MGRACCGCTQRYSETLRRIEGFLRAAIYFENIGVGVVLIGLVIWALALGFYDVLLPLGAIGIHGLAVAAVLELGEYVEEKWPARRAPPSHYQIQRLLYAVGFVLVTDVALAAHALTITYEESVHLGAEGFGIVFGIFNIVLCASSMALFVTTLLGWRLMVATANAENASLAKLLTPTPTPTPTSGHSAQVANVFRM